MHEISLQAGGAIPGAGVTSLCRAIYVEQWVLTAHKAGFRTSKSLECGSQNLSLPLGLVLYFAAFFFIVLAPFFVLHIKFCKTNNLRHYIRATLINYEDDATGYKRP